MIRVFYDGQCGLCQKEILYYQSIEPKGVFEWVDLTREPEKFTRYGLPVSEGLKFFYVLDESEHLHRGLDSFVVIWRHMPKLWPVLSHIVGCPGIRQLLRWVYFRFAAWRFKKMGYQCPID